MKRIRRQYEVNYNYNAEHSVDSNTLLAYLFLYSVNRVHSSFNLKGNKFLRLQLKETRASCKLTPDTVYFSHKNNGSRAFENLWRNRMAFVRDTRSVLRNGAAQIVPSGNKKRSAARFILERIKKQHISIREESAFWWFRQHNHLYLVLPMSLKLCLTLIKIAPLFVHSRRWNIHSKLLRRHILQSAPAQVIQGVSQ